MGKLKLAVNEEKTRISPLLANLFLHYAFDTWMARNYPHIPFERYADDAIWERIDLASDVGQRHICSAAEF
jgi:retron-type reverse transcriptase